jgi:hypothetical protein
VSGLDVNTQLLLHCDGVNGATSFPDASANNFTVTANGAAQVSTAQSEFGGASLVTAATSAYLSIADAAALRPGSGDFTYDFWLRLTAGSVFQTPLGKGYTAVGDILIQTDNAAAPNQLIYVSGSVVITSSTTYSLNVWHHVALVRSGSTLTLYIDGLSVGSASNSTNINGTNQLMVGGNTGSGGIYPVSGSMDEVRYSNSARWTSNFTPPTSPYSPDSAEVGIRQRWEFAPGSGPSKHLRPTRAYPRLPYTFQLTVSPGAYTLSGVTAATTAQRSFSAVKGAYTLTGNAITTKMARIVTAVQGIYILTGVATTLNKGKFLIAGVGAYVLTGIAAGLSAVRTMAMATGAYVLTGVTAALNRQALLTAVRGVYVFTGNAITTKTARIVTAVQGIYTLTGVAATLNKGKFLIAAAGAYVLTGRTAALSAIRTMAMATGVYILTGNATILEVLKSVSLFLKRRVVAPTLQLIRDVTPSLTLRRSVSPKLTKLRDRDPSLGD